MKYKIILTASEEGYSASCPELPGCWSQGATEKEAIENMNEAIQDYLAAVAASAEGRDVRSEQL